MRRVIIGVVLFIGIAVFSRLFFINRADNQILQTIEQEGSSAFGVSVKVSDIETDVKQGSATLTSLTIANPSNYQEPFALQMNDVNIDVDYKQKVINEIVINKPVITAEVTDSKNNFQDILDSLPQPEDSVVSKKQDQLSIKAIKVTQADIDLLSGTYILGEQTIPLDDFVIRDITGSPKEIARTVTVRLTHHIASQVESYVEQRSAHKITEKNENKASDTLEKQVDKKMKAKLRELEFYLG